MEIPNPYKPTIVHLDDSQTYSPTGLGLRFGIIFASPFLLSALTLMAICILKKSWNDLWLIGLPLPLGLAISFSGAWWGYCISKRMKFIFWVGIGLGQGFIQSLIFFSSSTLLPKFIHGFPKDLPNTVTALDFLLTTGAYALWAFALGCVIRWRFNKRALAHSPS